MTIKQALEMSTKKLAQKRIERPSLEAELLLASVLQQERVFVLTHPERKLTFWQNIRYRYLISLKINNWPTAYLTGHQEFFGLNFIVNKYTLIPRPETELLVETALELIPKDEPMNIIETGTGSGCIIISVARNNPNPETSYLAIEISKGALITAEKNAQLNGLDQKISFVKASLLTPVIQQEFSCPVMILANLPYLRPDQLKSSPSIQKEPQSALVSGSDGLDLYREMISQAATIKAPSLTLILEIDPSQSAAISQLAKDNWPHTEVEALKDFRDDDRIMIIKAHQS